MLARAIGRLAALTAVALLGLPAAAHAVVENFDTPPLAADTEVDDQFADTGIEFTADQTEGIATLPRIAIDAGKAKSGSRMLDISTDAQEFPTPRFAGFFDTQVTQVTVPVRNLYAPANAQLRLVAEGTHGTDATSFVSVNDTSGWVNLTLTAGPGENYFAFRVVSQSSQGIEVRVDDIDFTIDPAAVADYNLLTGDIGGVVLAGRTKHYTIDIQRLNGFADAVTLTGNSTVPFDTVTFTPNPASGSTATAHLTVPSDTAEDDDHVLTISGLADGKTRTLQIPFVVETPFSVRGSDTTLEAYSCATSELGFDVVRNRAFSESIGVLVRHRVGGETIPDDLDVSVSPASFPGGDTTVNRVTVSVTRGDDAGTDPVPLQLVARNGSIERTIDFDVQRALPLITSAAPTSLFTPQGLTGGTALTVRGNGFCPGAQVRVGNDQADAPGTLTAAPTASDPDRMQLRASTPRLATSGPISVLNPSGTIGSTAGLLPNAAVSSYRNRFGFRFENEDGVWEDEDEDGDIDEDDEPRPAGAGSLRDWQELLGPRQTNLNACEIGAIFPGCWEVITPIPSPAHGIMQTILGEASFYNRNGTCVGLAIASRRIAAGQASVLGRPAGGLAAPVWSLERTGRETIPGRGDIPLAGRQQFSPIKYAAVQHVAQTTAEYVQMWVQRRSVNAISGPAAMRAAIERHLRAGRRPLLNINWDGSGHAVNVYDVEDRPGGGYFLRFYDNNYPYVTGEEIDGPAHRTLDETWSRIEVTPGGSWTAPGIRSIVERNADGDVIRTEPRTGPTGDLSWIAVENELPVVPTSLAGLDGLRVLATPSLGYSFDRAARAAQDADSGLTELGYLDGDGSMLAAESDQRHTIPVEPGKGGRTEMGVFGEGTVAQVQASGSAARASAKGDDKVVLPRGGAEAIGFDAVRSSRADLTLIADKAGRMVRLTGARRGLTTVRFVGKGDRIEIVHKGRPGKVRLELSSFPQRGRATQFAATLRLGRKGTVRLKPRWKRLGNRLVARRGGKRVVLRSSVRPPVRVKRVRLNVVRRGDEARAKVRARLRGKLRRLRALVVQVEVRRAGRVVGSSVEQLRTGSRAVRRLRRGKRVAVPLKNLKGGGKLRARARVTASAGAPLPVGSTKAAAKRIP
ncbi:MAG TPA: hypothetical protein VD790_02315 [Thermoleophilaceae bacterium]|nr:hypothetical protein [Thermoleophilaceae bacterium]